LFNFCLYTRGSEGRLRPRDTFEIYIDEAFYLVLSILTVWKHFPVRIYSNKISVILFASMSDCRYEKNVVVDVVVVVVVVVVIVFFRERPHTGKEEI